MARIERVTPTGHGHWSDGLIGVPFRRGGRTITGADCWGLHRMACELAFGLSLPAYEELYADEEEVAANAELIAGHLSDWIRVLPGAEQACDGALMLVGKVPAHIATIIRPGHMLHTYAGGESRVDRYRSPYFKDRIVGFYRHRALA